MIPDDERFLWTNVVMRPLHYVGIVTVPRRIARQWEAVTLASAFPIPVHRNSVAGDTMEWYLTRVISYGFGLATCEMRGKFTP